jgi:hypothetical protein
MDAAILVPLEPHAGAAVRANDTQPPPADAEAVALSLALYDAQGWQPQIITMALASLGDISLPEPLVPPRNAGVLSTLPTLYWVYGLDQAGLLQAAETIAGLWASGAITVPLPDHGQALQQYWRTRRERLSADERSHLLGLVFDARDFEPAMRRLCQTLVALADNAGQRDIREEVGVEQAASALLDLCATRLEGAPLLGAPDLLAQTRKAVELLSQRALQTAFAVRDFYGLLDLGERSRGGAGGRSRTLAERAQAGAAVLRWIAQAAAQRFAIDPRAAALQTLIADAQRWLMSVPATPQPMSAPQGDKEILGPPGDVLDRSELGHEHAGVGVAA